MTQVLVKLIKLPHFQGNLPKYQTAGASGIDICAVLDSPVELKPLERALIPTGLTVEIPQGFEIQVRPRSGLALKQGITVLNTPGTVDSDYRGEVKIIVINLGEKPVTIQSGDRIAQFVVAPVVQAVLVEAEVISETQRGVGGFGSTGVNTAQSPNS